MEAILQSQVDLGNSGNFLFHILNFYKELVLLNQVS